MEAAAGRDDAVLIIDVLRFSSATVTAVSNGFTVIPATSMAEAKKLALKYDGCLNRSGRRVLSPKSFIGKAPCRVVLPSPNGAALSCHAAGAKNAFVASLLNISATAEKLNNVVKKSKQDVTIVASGEVGEGRRKMMPVFERRLDTKDENFCFEDYVCAGAVSSLLKAGKSDSILRAEKAFRMFSVHLKEALLDCASGRYLIKDGLKNDVEFYSRLDVFSVVPAIHKFKWGAEIG